MNDKNIEENSIMLVVENLENMLSNPANNNLPIYVRDIIETSVRLLKVESETLTQYKEVLNDALDFLGKLFAQNPYDKDVEEIRFKLIKAKQLLNNE